MVLHGNVPDRQQLRELCLQSAAASATIYAASVAIAFLTPTSLHAPCWQTRVRAYEEQSIHSMLSLRLLCIALLGLISLANARLRIPRFRPPPYSKTGVLGAAPGALNSRLIEQCDELWRDARLDHFTWAKEGKDQTFKQRYFICKNDWGLDDDGNLGPIFFYLGNEADVTLYLNNSGLMWESAPSFRAMLVFAEHRYYGKSVPFGDDVLQHMQYLSAEQAMADYAELIDELKQEYNCTDSPVIGFGGSYGGMLAAWFRMKYPHLMDGAIAASAPIWNFMGEVPPFDPVSFAKAVTWDASEEGGSAPACAANVRDGWKIMEAMGRSHQGRHQISKAMRLCRHATPRSPEEVMELRNWLADAWDYMAMGNFPYPSGYILNGHGQLPAYPVRVACQYLADRQATDFELLQGLAKAAGVYYNHSGDLLCFDYRQAINPDSERTADFWSYQYCTEMFMPFGKSGEVDMFWRDDWDPDAVAEGCEDQWGVTPRMYWANTEWGGRKIDAASNIVFSNGLLDPWHSGGVLRDMSGTLVALVIPEGAHHLDLMFSNPLDPPSVIEVRRQQQKWMHHWIKQARHEEASKHTAAAHVGVNMLNVGVSSVRDDNHHTTSLRTSMLYAGSSLAAHAEQ